jgi:hypothetical protein
LSNDVTTDEPFQEPLYGKRKEKTKNEIEEGVVLSRDELHAVTVYCRLPTEVTTALQNLG